MTAVPVRGGFLRTLAEAGSQNLPLNNFVVTLEAEINWIEQETVDPEIDEPVQPFTVPSDRRQLQLQLTDAVQQNIADKPYLGQLSDLTPEEEQTEYRLRSIDPLGQMTVDWDDMQAAIRFRLSYTQVRGDQTLSELRNSFKYIYSSESYQPDCQVVAQRAYATEYECEEVTEKDIYSLLSLGEFTDSNGQLIDAQAELSFINLKRVPTTKGAAR